MIGIIAQEMIAYFGNDVRRINHAIKVSGFAETIMSGMDVDEKTREVVNITAILHDIGIKECERKYRNTSGTYQHIECPPIAKSILDRLKYDPETVQRVCFIIGNHHSYDAIDNIDFQIIVEADFIVNAFEGNLEKNAVRSFADTCFRTETGKNIIRSMYLHDAP